MKLLANFYACLAIILLIGLLEAEGRATGGGAGRKNGIREMEETLRHSIVRRNAPTMTEEDLKAQQIMNKPEEFEPSRARRSVPTHGLDEPEEPKQFRSRRQVSVDEPEEPKEPKQLRTRRHVSVDEPEEPEEPKQIRSRRQLPDFPTPQMPGDMPMPPVPQMPGK